MRNSSRGGLADQFLGLRGIGDARQLHDDPAVALAGNQRLAYAELVDAVPDDLDGALDRVGDVGSRGELGDVELHEQVRAAFEVKAQVEQPLGALSGRPRTSAVPRRP